MTRTGVPPSACEHNQNGGSARPDEWRSSGRRTPGFAGTNLPAVVHNAEGRDDACS